MLTLSALALLGLFAREPALPVLGKAPEFALVDQAGQPFAGRTLAGKVWACDFIYTTCQDTCPRLTRTLARVQHKLRDVPAVRFVSFSVDPEHDTPARLRSFAARNGADTATWTFLTGKTNPVLQGLARGFKIYAGGRTSGKGAVQTIMHGDHIVLVDAAGQLRGFYRPDGEGMMSLERDMRRLAAGKR